MPSRNAVRVSAPTCRQRHLKRRRGMDATRSDSSLDAYRGFEHEFTRPRSDCFHIQVFQDPSILPTRLMIARSSIVALFPPSLCYKGSVILNKQRASRAETVVQEITDTVNENLIRRQCFLGRDPEDLSPWGLYFAYYLCRHYICHGSKRGAEDWKVVQNLKEGLSAVDVRWNVAGKQSGFPLQRPFLIHLY